MEKAAFGVAWSNQTVLDPVEAAILIAMAIVLLTCKRRYAIWPIIVVACFVVPSQRIVIGGVDFTLMRLMSLVGLLRVLATGEIKGFSWNKLDSAMLAFTLVKIFIVLLLDIPGEFVTRLGGGLDSFGMYFVCRCLIRDWSDVFSAVRGFIWVGIPVAVCFLIEFKTRKNVFGVFGYVPDLAEVREGKSRAQGAFAQPIIAGVFWATLMPLMIALAWRGRKAALEAVLGLAVATTIVVCSASSTPYMAILFGIIGAMMFRLRSLMRPIRWGLLVAFCLFQILSDKPAWRLIADVDVVGGSTGYYRYKLIDQTVKHFDQWWAVGGDIQTSSWSPELVDDTNYFVVIALQGGLPLLTALVVSLAFAFGGVGRIWRQAGANRPDVIAAWALGVCILMHITSFLGVTYFGQIVMLWNLTLAMVGSLMPRKSLKRPSQNKKPVMRRRIVARQRPLAAAPVSFTLGN